MSHPETGARRRGRRVLAAVAAVAFLATAGSTYAATSARQKSRTTVDCSGQQCIPTLKLASVVDALRGQGYACKDDYYSTSCELTLGEIRFEAVLENEDGLIHSVEARAGRPANEQQSDGIVTYLTWFATLPYSGNAGLTAQIGNWVTNQVKSGKSTAATIGGYSYELNASHPDSVDFTMKGM